MAAVKYEFPIGALKAFYSTFCADILLLFISRNAVSENRKNRPPKFHRSAPLNKIVKALYIKPKADFYIYSMFPLGHRLYLLGTLWYVCT